MAEYEVVENNVNKVWEFNGRNVWQPEYRCSKCSRAIQESYTRTSGVCYDCNEGDIPIGDDLEKVYAMSVYISDIKNTEFIQGLYDLKDEQKYTSEFSDLLAKGINEYTLTDYDLIVVPPSGTADSGEENHMIPLAEELSNEVSIPFENITYKEDGYSSQKQLDHEERIENVSGNIGCTETSLSAEKALVIDDIATSCATLSATAQALTEAGVSTVTGLVIARDENTQGLEHANVLKKVED